MGIEDLLGKIDAERDPMGDVEGTRDVFDRQYGAELTRWELGLLSKFRERSQGTRQYILRGFVHHTREPSLILLAPSPWLIDGVLIYIPLDQELPEDGSFIEVTGHRVAAPSILVAKQSAVEAFTAESVEVQPLDVTKSISPSLDLKQLSGMLFEHVGMAEASKRVFARLFVSSPPYADTVGGLTAGIQAITSKNEVKRLLGFMRKILPPSLSGRSEKYREVRYVKVYTPRIWRLDVGSFGVNKMRTLCTDRRDAHGFREVSLTALTETETSSLPDIPLAIASEDFWIERKDPTGLRLPILKAVITYQMLTPAVSQRTLDSSTKHVLERLEHMKESFGLPDSTMARGQILDADSMGRSLSTLRLARSTARAEWNEKVSAADVKNAWDHILEPALKEFIELTELKTETGQGRDEHHMYDRFNTKVIRAVRKLDPGKSGELGPTLDDIAYESGVERHVVAEQLSGMKDAGLVFEPRPGRFRLV